MMIDSREKQYVDAIKLYIEAGIRGSCFVACAGSIAGNFFGCFYCANCCYAGYYNARHLTWSDIAEDVRGRCKKGLMLLDGYTSTEEYDLLVKSIDDLYQGAKKSFNFD